MDDMPDFEQLGKIINAVKTARLLSEAMQGGDSGGDKREGLDLSAILSPSPSSSSSPSSSPSPSPSSSLNPNPNPSPSSSLSPSSSANPNEANICAFDKELQSPAIRSIKAAIPYLEGKYQRNMGIAVKLMEMDRLLNHYTVLAAEKGGDRTKEMLLAVKGELPPQNQFAADLLIKILEIRDITAAAAV